MAIVNIEGLVSYEEDGLKTIEITNYNIAARYAFAVINNVEEIPGPKDLTDLIVEYSYIPHKSKDKMHVSITIESGDDIDNHSS